MRTWRDGDPLVGTRKDWSGLAKTKKRPRTLIWVRRKNKPGSQEEWKTWLRTAQKAAKLGDGFPGLHLLKAGRKRILTGDLPQGKWIPLFRIRKRKGGISLPAALQITYETAKLLEKAESLGLISDKPLQRELLFDQQDSSLLLCGHWRLIKNGESHKNTSRLIELFCFLCGDGPGKKELVNRLESKRASGRVQNTSGIKRELAGELDILVGDNAAGATEWFVKRKFALGKVIPVVLVGAAICFGAWGSWQLIHSHGRPLPNMVGAKLAQAKQKAKEGSWPVKIKFQTSSMMPGYVIKQDPAPHTVLPSGKAVVLVISKPAKTVLIPDLVGLDFNDARDTLWSSGLNWNPKPVKSGRVGIVSKTFPRAGQSLPGGFAVTVYYGIP